MSSFESQNNELPEEHIRHLARFAGEMYVEGEFQKWSKFAQFKWCHYNQLKGLEKDDGEYKS